MRIKSHNLKKFKTIAAMLLALSGLGIADYSFAKTLNLPEGIGIWTYGYRSYDSLSLRFDREGYVESIGDDFKQNFDGKSLLSSGDSSDLGTLAEELNKFDYAGDQSGVLAGLDLGTFGVDVSASVSTHIFGVGYGINKWLTAYAGFPLINVNVSTRMYMTGNNTAQDLKDRLGDLSFEELKDGLDTASSLDVQMIKTALTDMGYSGLDRWEHSGFGDINAGLATSYEYRPTSDLGFTPYSKLNITLPTGHVDDPDILTDTSTGYGYFSGSVMVGQVVSVGRYAYGGIEGVYQKNFTYSKEVRRPQASTSTLAPYENREAIDINPGDQTQVSIYGGAEYWIFSGEYKLTDTNTKKDEIVSSSDPVYRALVNDSETNAFAQKVSATISTADLYQKKKFPIPLMFTVSQKTNLAGKNAIIDDFFEVELASFFKFN